MLRTAIFQIESGIYQAVAGAVQQWMPTCVVIPAILFDACAAELLGHAMHWLAIDLGSAGLYCVSGLPYSCCLSPLHKGRIATPC